MVKKSYVCGKLNILFLYYTPFEIFIFIHGIIVNSDLVYQHLYETEHLYYLFGSSSKRMMLLCHLVDHITKLPESGVLCDNITEFGVAEDHLSPQGFT